MAEAVIDVEELKTYFHTEEGVVRAVDGVSFRIQPGGRWASSARAGPARA